MNPGLFSRIIAHLKKNYEVVNLEWYLQNRDQLRGSNKKVATVLFDDGYRDNIEYAAPILHKYQCPASFYVVTSCIDQNIPTWTYVLDHQFQQTGRTRLELPVQIDGLPQATDFTDKASRIQFGKHLKPLMKKLPNADRVAVCDAVSLQFDDVEIPRDKMMSWQHLSELSSSGFTIASHSVNHPLLASIENADELFHELRFSAQRIQNKLGFFPATISYPIGSYDSRVTEAAKTAGYKYGLAVKQKVYEDTDDIMTIPRIELYNEGFLKSRLRMTGLI